MTAACRPPRLPAVLALVWFACAAPAAAGGEPPPDVTEPPPYGEFVVIPLRVHILTSRELPEVDCHLTDADIARVLGKVNAIWHNAGVHWGLESVVREPAAREARFRLARDLDGPGNLGLFALLMPEGSHRFDGLHVYYIHRFAVNGVWLEDDRAAVVQETAKLRPVEGGSDEPLPRVTAHELGLSHRQDRTNLLASGTTGTRLNAREVEIARKAARALKGAARVADLRAAAERATDRGEVARARRLWTWLAEVPGAGAREARARLDALNPPAPRPARRLRDGTP